LKYYNENSIPLNSAFESYFLWCNLKLDSQKTT
jgi:hypothetical protein